MNTNESSGLIGRLARLWTRWQRWRAQRMLSRVVKLRERAEKLFDAAMRLLNRGSR